MAKEAHLAYFEPAVTTRRSNAAIIVCEFRVSMCWGDLSASCLLGTGDRTLNSSSVYLPLLLLIFLLLLRSVLLWFDVGCCLQNQSNRERSRGERNSKMHRRHLEQEPPLVCTSWSLRFTRCSVLASSCGRTLRDTDYRLPTRIQDKPSDLVGLGAFARSGFACQVSGSPSPGLPTFVGRLPPKRKGENDRR